MKRIFAFGFILLFAVLFLVSCMPGICDQGYGKMLCTTGQAGLGISIVAFLMMPRKNRVRLPLKKNDERN